MMNNLLAVTLLSLLLSGCAGLFAPAKVLTPAEKCAQGEAALKELETAKAALEGDNGSLRKNAGARGPHTAQVRKLSYDLKSRSYSASGKEAYELKAANRALAGAVKTLNSPGEVSEPVYQGTMATLQQARENLLWLRDDACGVE